MTPERTGHKIVVVATDPLLAALVGYMVEIARFTAAFPASGELPDQTLARVRPVAAILLDGSDSAAESDLFVSRARRLGVRVLVFGAPEIVRARGEWARTHDLPVFALPNDVARLGDALEALLPPPRRPRAVLERRAASGERRPDGTMVFCDASGMRWSVYDRRGADRRRDIDRRFVSDVGEVRHCNISPAEAGEFSVAALAEQFDRAAPVG